ncbi:MAG: ABZJ_00895 family protein, partial [Hasllibacter sp.]
RVPDMARNLGRLLIFAALTAGAVLLALANGRNPLGPFAAGGLAGAFLWGIALARHWGGRPPARETLGVIVLMAGGTMFLFAVLVGFFDAGQRFLALAEADPDFLPGFAAVSGVYFACLGVAMLLGQAMARPFVRRRPGAEPAGADPADEPVATYRADPFRQRPPEPELPAQQRLEPTYLARERAVAEAVAREEAATRGPRLLPLLPRFVLMFYLVSVGLAVVLYFLDWDGNVGLSFAPVYAAAIHVGGVYAKRGGTRIPGWRAFGFGLLANAVTAAPILALLWASGALDGVLGAPPAWRAGFAAAMVLVLLLQAAATRWFMGIGLKGELKRRERLTAQAA